MKIQAPATSTSIIEDSWHGKARTWETHNFDNVNNVRATHTHVQHVPACTESSEISQRNVYEVHVRTSGISLRVKLFV